jgi:hypothetical protein
MAHTSSPSLIRTSKPSSESNQKDGQGSPTSIACSDEESQEEWPARPQLSTLIGRDELLTIASKPYRQELLHVPEKGVNDVCTTIDLFQSIIIEMDY